MNAECERVRLSAMARMDGETPDLDAAAESAHLAACADCRNEVAAMTAVDTAFAGRRRETPGKVGVWPEVAAGLEGRPARPRSLARHPVLIFGGLALVLFACRLLEVTPGFEVSLWAKSLPVLSAAIVLSLLGENPFRLREDLSA